MKIARIRDSKVKETYGIISDDGKSLVTKAEIQQQTGIPVPPSIKDFMFGGWLEEVKQQRGRLRYTHKVGDVELLVPIPNPPKIICLAFNYFDHARDAGLTPSDEPVIFMKPRTALNEPFRDVICPSFVTRLDYEAELAVVVGKRTRKVAEEAAMDSVFGYMVFHDVSQLTQPHLNRWPSALLLTRQALPHAGTGRDRLDVGTEALREREHVGVRDHDAFRLGGGARREDDLRDVVARNRNDGHRTVGMPVEIAKPPQRQVRPFDWPSGLAQGRGIAQGGDVVADERGDALLGKPHAGARFERRDDARAVLLPDRAIGARRGFVSGRRRDELDGGLRARRGRGEPSSDRNECDLPIRHDPDHMSKPAQTGRADAFCTQPWRCAKE